MSRKDFYHDCVKAALQKAGWRITDEQLPLRFYGTRLYVDMAATRLEPNGDVSYAAVEVKNFRERFDYINELQKALGQYLMYRQLLALREFPHVLYLAIPEHAYQSLFQDELVKSLLNVYAVKLVVFDPVTETVLQWNP